MPNIEVRGKYRTFRYDGDAPLDFTPYNNSIFLIRRPNPTTFVTLQQYVPGQGGVFTTFLPGSSYTIVTNADGSQDFNFDMGPYTRVDRLPSSTTIKSPNFYIGLDKNSIVVPISSYALGYNPSLISVVNILYINGQGNRLQYLAADSFRTGAPVNFTHFLPNSGYELRTRLPFTFFAPLQSEMGDAFALGNNDAGQYGMGHLYTQTRYFNDVNDTPFVLSADQTFGIWDKIVFNGTNHLVTWNSQNLYSTSQAALSSCGTSKALFVLGSNFYGQLGTGSSQQYYPTWTRVPGQWLDVDMGSQHMVAINNAGHLYACGSNASGQCGLGSGVASTNTLTLVDNTRNYVQVVATSSTSHARDINGSVYSCGWNAYGQLGIGNTTTYVYDLTREATNSAWTSIKTIKGAKYVLLALKNNALYGCGSDSKYFGGPAGVSSFLTRDALNLADITDFYTTGFGTFITRQGQDYLFAAGANAAHGDTNLLATVSGGTAVYFTKTTIPSQMRNIISNYSYERPPEGSAVTRYNIGYIGADFNVYTKQLNTNVFVQKEFKAFDAFSQPIYAGGTSTFQECPIFLLSAASHFRPTPTPTITLTPTVTPTPTKTPVPPPPPSFGAIVVAGGGGGGWGRGIGVASNSGAGGGAGGVIYLNSVNVTLGITYELSVGAGGRGGPSNTTNGDSGSQSYIYSPIGGYLAICSGGGRGGNGSLGTGVAQDGTEGGSGSGGAGPGTRAGLGVAGQGNNGSTGWGINQQGGTGGGGGGSTQAATPASPNSGGKGGNGQEYTVGSTKIAVGGGGGGGKGLSQFAGSGGFGGGGNGGNESGGAAGIDLTGGGGGGGSWISSTSRGSTGGKGGDGAIYIFYPSSYKDATVTGATFKEISGDYKIYTFRPGLGTFRFN